MDVLIAINEGFDLTQAKGTILTSFLCGANGAAACPTCHPSCLFCTTTGQCDSCNALDRATKSSDGAFCVCDSVTAWDEVDYFRWCCNAGCSYCAGVSPAACMKSEDEASFATLLTALYSLPLASAANGLMCYRQPVPTLTCDPLLAVIGNIGTAAGPDECFKLLTGQWPYVKYWFSDLFPNFTPPTATSYEVYMEVYMLKTVLWLWILQYGPSVLKSESAWQGLVTTFNNASLDWTKLLAWAGASTGYSPDGTATALFPAELEATLTQASPELQLFNHFSTLCNSACPLGAQCRQINPTSICN